MGGFLAKVVQYEDRVKVDLIGNLDEQAQLPNIGPTKKIILKASGIRLVNAAGLRSWCKWVQSLRGDIIFQECPFVFAKHFSALRGLLPPKVVVASFYVPFINDSGDERRDILYERGVDFQDDGSFKVRKLVDHRGSPMTMDVNEKTYFSFIQREV